MLLLFLISLVDLMWSFWFIIQKCFATIIAQIVDLLSYLTKAPLLVLCQKLVSCDACGDIISTLLRADSSRGRLLL